VYPGGFRDYERAGRAVSEPPPVAAPRAKGKPSKPPEPGKDGKDKAVDRYEEQKQAARALERKKKRIQELEGSIASGEKELDQLRGKLRSAPGDDWEKLAKMAQEEQALTKRVDSMLVEWARLSEEVK